MALFYQACLQGVGALAGAVLVAEGAREQHAPARALGDRRAVRWRGAPGQREEERGGIGAVGGGALDVELVADALAVLGGLGDLAGEAPLHLQLAALRDALAAAFLVLDVVAGAA